MQTTEAVCRKCGAPILMIEGKGLRKLAVNEKPFTAIQVKEGIGETIEVYAPHWATCRGKKEA